MVKPNVSTKPSNNTFGCTAITSKTIGPNSCPLRSSLTTTLRTPLPECPLFSLTRVTTLISLFILSEISPHPELANSPSISTNYTQSSNSGSPRPKSTTNTTPTSRDPQLQTFWMEATSMSKPNTSILHVRRRSYPTKI